MSAITPAPRAIVLELPIACSARKASSIALLVVNARATLEAT